MQSPIGSLAVPFLVVFAMAASIASLVVAYGLPRWIAYLKQRTLGQAIREEGPQSHSSKQGTPTAGGWLVLLGWFLSVLAGLWLGFFPVSMPLLLCVTSTLVLGLVGFYDDWLKMTQKHNSGISGYAKLLLQALMGAAIGYWVVQHNGGITSVFGYDLAIGWLYPLFSAWVMAAFSNAVNLTDGLDGLAASTLVITFFALGIVFTIHAVLPGGAYMAYGAVGGLLVFWCYNRFPAKVFMGDTGSLALGGLIAALGILAGLEWWLLAFGLLFVLEAFSVVLQVASFKLTGKRIFRMSPLHHHFELGGLKEAQVVRLFMWIQVVGVIAGAALLQGWRGL